ncbi:hypothetical protein [Otariodibacter oris]|uniref:3-hydroxymyristoyl/3-hydroxydecanoyl-(Acyl carrier protein) dehydratase n=1 Tax=Otariodibacter oris TaxID=1032623 RepID=A0A420XGJ5_9PAST|nr:hypothetical protein [Otariodibacter oris]QGM79968.1 hypothetical protein A6A10_00390 [Otariodibacter oris]RKR71791.1 3-hydroxymyristoyl/3-hydroxydecanoyl-(acyl carrier protein) dehydratase [Otariodibacter oris]
MENKFLNSIQLSLNNHNLISDCYIAYHPQKADLVVWAELSADGINLFREKGRNAVIEQSKTYLLKQEGNLTIPELWYFIDKLPRDHQSHVDLVAFEETCTTEIVDPIWIKKEYQDEQLVLKGKVPIDLTFFKGHFAGFPLVPGVIELQWVNDQITECLGVQKTILRVDNLKFQKFLRPNDDIELHLTWQPENNRVIFQLKTDNEMCSSGRILFCDE